MSRKRILTRRDFLKLAGISTVGGLVLSTGCTSNQIQTETPIKVVKPEGDDIATEVHESTSTAIQPKTQDETNEPSSNAYLSVAHGENPTEITRAAIAAIGGMQRFVKNGSNVVIKPNICTDYHPPEFAVTTNPIVVATLVQLCIESGAKRVRVMDYPFGGTPRSAYAISGIAEAVEAVGGEMHVMNPVKFLRYNIPQGKDLREYEFYQDAIEADVFIDVPIAKHHSLARLTLAGKNLLGIIKNRGAIHQNLDQRIADLVSFVCPSLTIVDAVRILMAHGPTGGNLGDVKQTNTVIASTDIVAADSYAATLFGLTANDIGYVKAAADMGLGKSDLRNIKLEEINL